MKAPSTNQEKTMGRLLHFRENKAEIKNSEGGTSLRTQLSL